MKRLGKIPSQLFSQEQTSSLKLKNQPYVILIPKEIFQKKGITNDDILWDLIIKENKITLVGPCVSASRRVKQPSTEEIVA